MNTGSRGARRWRTAVLGAIAVGATCGGGPAAAEDTAGRSRAAPAGAARSVETVHFADRRLAPVQLVRGAAAPAERPIRRETVSFGDGTAARVTIVRGVGDPAAAAAAAAPTAQRHAALAPQKTVETVEFAGSAPASVIVVRGTAARRELASTDLFRPAAAGDLDRIVHAVHGAESSHGTDSRMWRPDPEGPQGPMQVSAAAALDVGGGNRFDIFENHKLGRAYLARMFQRYGNWPDALAAYNWGPGNVDQWIARGRRAERLPAETIRYIERVLRDALITTTAARL